MDTISVIIPTHNRLSFLRRAIKSVQNQSFKNLEIIVVDDASTDNTKDFLIHLQKSDLRLKFTQHKKIQGGAAARNTGIHLSRGKWIAFLDDDDYWFPDKLEFQLNILKQHPEVIACTCFFIFSLPWGYKYVFTPPDAISLEELLCRNSLGGVSMCLCSMEKLREVGGFDKNLRSVQDWDLWIRLRQKGKIICCRKVLVYYESHSGLRISRDISALYSGWRHLYFKYSYLMDKNMRRIHILKLCHLRSKKKKRQLLFRLLYIFRLLIMRFTFRYSG